MSQAFATADLRAAQIDGIPSISERRSLDLALIAKGVCSGVFVSNRSVEDILRYSIKPETEDGLPVRVEVREDAQLVLATLDDGTQRAARIVGDHGAVVLPLGSAKPYFTPRPITSTLPPADEMDWPMGDRNAEEQPGASWNKVKLANAVDSAFAASPNTYTAALLIAHKGQLIAERYGHGAHGTMQLPSWSMGKSLTGAFIGRLAQEGHLTLEDKAPITEWSRTDDPRSAIRIADLMQMCGGLDFTAAWSGDYTPEKGFPDHSYMYGGAIDVFQLALSRAAAHPSGTFGAYKNSDTLALGAIVKRTVEALGEDYLSWPQRALFDRIGIRQMVLEPDPYGNLVTSGFCYGTARDWVRLGLLFLQGGVWQGERLFPPGFIDFVRTPAPGWSGKYWTGPGPDGWKGSIYGGQVWLNQYPAADAWPLPADAYFMLGIGGQYTFVVPSMDLVIVRMGHVRGVLDTNAGREPLATALQHLMDAYEGSKS